MIFNKYKQGVMQEVICVNTWDIINAKWKFFICLKRRALMLASDVSPVKHMQNKENLLHQQKYWNIEIYGLRITFMPTIPAKVIITSIIAIFSIVIIVL